MRRFRLAPTFLSLTIATSVAATSGARHSTVSAAERATEPASEAGAASVLTPPQALALTLESSPALQPFSWEIRAEEARLLQAGLLPNPRAEGLVEDVLGSGNTRGGRQAQLTLQLGQLVELGGKRAARVEAASRSVDVARQDYETKRVEVLADATARFVDVVERQHLHDLAAEAMGLDEATLDAVKRRAGAGAGSPLEEKRAEVALAQSRLAREEARRELAAARAALAASWGDRVARFARVEADLFARRRVPPQEELQKRLDGSPAIARLVTEERLRAAELRLAETKRVPDVTLSAGPRWRESVDEGGFVFGLSLPLPVFDRNPGGIAEARARAGKTVSERRAEEVRLWALLFRLRTELGRASHVLEVLEREILPRAEEALSISREGFEGGRFSHLELLDAGRTFLETRRRRIEAAASLHRFVLEIERLTGTPLDDDEPKDPEGADQP